MPSSPYMEDDGYLTWNLSEWHEWAQKEFFRSDHFKEMKNQFISETGYFSFPSINSLKYFLKEPYNFYDSKSDEYSDEFKAHIVSMEKDTKAKYYFRTSFVKKHILDLFGYYPDKLDDVVKMSQISQAEALKYFIERMRIKRDKNGGIIIWNLLDGYTQISDSLIDYYFRKKLSYYYVKRSQQPLCFIMDSSNSLVSLYCVNDYSLDFKVSYKATDLKTKNILTKGELTIGGHSNLKVAEIDSSNMEPTFYLIEWSINNEFVGKNHYCPVLPGIKYEDYLKYMCDSQFENFE